MPKKRDLKIFLDDILEEIEKIEKFTKGIQKPEDLEKNEVIYYAVLKALENIGEAVKHIPEEMRDFHALEWKKIAGLRDIIIHEYFGIDTDIIWDVVKNKLPMLKLEIKKMLL